ncbi:hypothetical protein SHELI_v1c10970 [Spiroplasma helicoides]|uniref:Transmembrane protein n=1 Tax=Spiroplasma helicoides TaxID=216938 RepID=A0A1B3SM86_9MOLU|nr:hypothetical protein [Spiroplasma helicoides]AOG61044.1 hypothetical protein SHELI_v1c10970 [Spiroplasma helicoides]
MFLILIIFAWSIVIVSSTLLLAFGALVITHNMWSGVAIVKAIFKILSKQPFGVGFFTKGDTSLRIDEVDGQDQFTSMSSTGTIIAGAVMMAIALMLYIIAIIELVRAKKRQKISKPYIKSVLVLLPIFGLLYGQVITIILAAALIVAWLLLEGVLFDSEALNNYAEERNLIAIYKEEKKFEKEVSKEGKLTGNVDLEALKLKHQKNMLDQNEKANTNDSSALPNPNILKEDTLEVSSSVNSKIDTSIHKKVDKKFDKWKFEKDKLEATKQVVVYNLDNLSDSKKEKTVNDFNKKIESLNKKAEKLKIPSEFYLSYIAIEDVKNADQSIQIEHEVEAPLSKKEAKLQAKQEKLNAKKAVKEAKEAKKQMLKELDEDTSIKMKDIKQEDTEIEHEVEDVVEEKVTNIEDLNIDFDSLEEGMDQVEEKEIEPLEQKLSEESSDNERDFDDQEINLESNEENSIDDIDSTEEQEDYIILTKSQAKKAAKQAKKAAKQAAKQEKFNAKFSKNEDKKLSKEDDKSIKEEITKSSPIEKVTNAFNDDEIASEAANESILKGFELPNNNVDSQYKDKSQYINDLRDLMAYAINVDVNSLTPITEDANVNSKDIYTDKKVKEKNLLNIALEKTENDRIAKLSNERIQSNLPYAFRDQSIEDDNKEIDTNMSDEQFAQDFESKVPFGHFNTETSSEQDLKFVVSNSNDTNKEDVAKRDAIYKGILLTSINEDTSNFPKIDDISNADVNTIYSDKNFMDVDLTKKAYEDAQKKYNSPKKDHIMDFAFAPTQEIEQNETKEALNKVNDEIYKGIKLDSVNDDISKVPSVEQLPNADTDTIYSDKHIMDEDLTKQVYASKQEEYNNPKIDYIKNLAFNSKPEFTQDILKDDVHKGMDINSINEDVNTIKQVEQSFNADTDTIYSDKNIMDEDLTKQVYTEKQEEYNNPKNDYIKNLAFNSKPEFTQDILKDDVHKGMDINSINEDVNTIKQVEQSFNADTDTIYSDKNIMDEDLTKQVYTEKQEEYNNPKNDYIKNLAFNSKPEFTQDILKDDVHKGMDINSINEDVNTIKQVEQSSNADVDTIYSDKHIMDEDLTKQELDKELSKFLDNGASSAPIPSFETYNDIIQPDIKAQIITDEINRNTKNVSVVASLPKASLIQQSISQAVSIKPTKNVMDNSMILELEKRMDRLESAISSLDNKNVIDALKEQFTIITSQLDKITSKVNAQKVEENSKTIIDSLTKRHVYNQK